MNCQKINVKHVLARLLIASLGFTQILPAAYAVSTDIADIPLAVKSSVPPNIMFMLDNSGSMDNIVPDTPFDPQVTYLASCPAANTVAGGVAGPGLPVETDRIDIQIKSGVPKIMRSSQGGTTGPSDLTSGVYDYGTGNKEKCFDPAKRYNVRLYANSGNTSGNPPTSCTNTCSPGSYLDAVYEGNYLNWYFGNAPGYTTAGNFGTSLSKPGTLRRIDITKVAAKSVIDSLNNVRLGLSSYNSATSGNGGELLEIMGDIAADPNRTRIKAKIDAIKSSGSTPLAETLSDLGGYFSNGYSGNLTLHPGATNSSTATVANVFNNHTIRDNTNTAGYPRQNIVSPPPIQYFCQKSFAIVMTDGRPQADRNISSSLRDYTGDCAAGSCDATPNQLLSGDAGQSGGANTSVAITSANNLMLKNGVKIGRGYEFYGSDYLDDVAAGMFDIDLRPDLVKPAGSSQKKNNLLTYPIGFAEIQLLDDPFLQATADKGQGLAAGGGLSLNATNAATLVTAFQAAADDILGKDRGASAVAVANANVSSQDGDNQSFASSYNAGSWTGDLQAYPIDLTTGQPDQSQPTWRTGCADWTAKVDLSDPNSPPKGCSAQEQLNERTTPRLIATYSGTSSSPNATGQGVPFQPASTISWNGAGSSGALSALLNTPVTPPGPSDGNAVITYLRGARTGETATYRSRNRTLGDIVNAEPVIVNKPKANYADAGYNAFKTQWATTTPPRARMVYQGANDGMLHAFNASTGKEEWAYIPNLVIPNLNNLSRRSGFAHKFYVDGTPTSGDIDFNNVGINGTGTSDWHTILVGGLAKGGRGFYALDVTDPIAADEAAVAGKVMWEFPNNATNATVKLNIGYSFARPVIVKTQNYGWVVLVSSGYNNGSTAGGADGTGGDGGGYLFVLDAKTGNLIQAVPTSVSGANVGTATAPSGLAQVAAYADNSDVNNITTTAYGGDLNGNVWRFSLAGDKAGWNATRLAIFKDPSGNTQPVTSLPEFASIKISGTYKRFVYVGTGQYLGDKDPLDPNADSTKENSHTRQVQTIYGLVDDGSTTIDGVNGARSQLQQQTVSENGAKERTYSQNAVNFSTQKGWYFDLPITGERSVTDPQLALGALVFTTNIPISTPCVPGGTSYLNVLDYKTGGNIDVRDPVTNALIPSGSYLGSALASRGVLIKLPDVNNVSGDVKALIRRSDGTTTVAKVPVPLGAFSGKRVSWREVPDR